MTLFYCIIIRSVLMFYNDIIFHIIDNYTHTNFTPRLFSLQISMWPLPITVYQ